MLGTQEGGNETYVQGLLQGFETLTDQQISITAVYNKQYKPRILSGMIKQNVTLRSASNLQRLFMELPRLGRSYASKLLHVSYNAPPLSRLPFVVSVHDVSFRHYPEYFSPRTRLLLSTLLPYSMRRAKHIITLSEASKRDIIQFYPYTYDKLSVIPLAAGLIASTQPDPVVAARYTDKRGFILAVGTVQPRKNIARLIHAYVELRNQNVTEARLIIVGRSAWQHSTIQQIALSSRYADDIIFTGYLADAEVASLYQACKVFVYPSLYEGFGLPVLEAMQLGAPVITSNISSLPEVAGDAAILIDPYSVLDIRTGLQEVLTNDIVREDLRRRGKQRAARFSWERTAHETLTVYYQALAIGVRS